MRAELNYEVVHVLLQMLLKSLTPKQQVLALDELVPPTFQKEVTQSVDVDTDETDKLQTRLPASIFDNDDIDQLEEVQKGVQDETDKLQKGSPVKIFENDDIDQFEEVQKGVHYPILTLVIVFGACRSRQCPRPHFG